MNLFRPLTACLLLVFLAAGRPTPASAGAPALHVHVAGHGRPMVLIPGLACSGDVWADAVARYSGRSECHLVTLGGFAGEPAFEGPFLATVRDSLVAYLRARRLDHPILIGHSLGGVVALEVALAAPREVGPLVILDALPFLGGAGQPGATSETVKAGAARFRDLLRGETQEQYAEFQRTSPMLKEMVASPENLSKVIDWAARSDHAAVGEAMYDVYTVDLREDLGALGSPVLVLGTWYGMRAMTTKPAVEATFKAQFAKLPHWELAVADSARHFLMLDDPAWTWGQVDRFLAQAAR